MCGIIGFFNTKGEKNTHWDLNVIFDTLLHWRRKGVDGMGMLVISDDEWLGMKDKVIQSEFIIKYGNHIADYVNDPKTRAIIFHNRWATHGNKTSEGCHPFIGNRYVLMHNGSFNPKLLHTSKEWEYKCDSDTEKVAALLNDSTFATMRPEELLSGLSKKIYKAGDMLGIFVVYDTHEDMLYVLRSQEREFCYHVENKHITRFWNDFSMASRFADKREILLHGGMLKIDPNCGEIVKEWTNILPPPPVKTVVTASTAYKGGVGTTYSVPAKTAAPTSYGPRPTPIATTDLNKQIEAQRDRINGGAKTGKGSSSYNKNALNDPFVVEDNPTPEQLSAMIGK